MRKSLLVLAVLLIASMSVAAQDWQLEPTFGEVYLEGGFTPDPYEVEIMAGGSIDASDLCGECAGYIAEAPDFDLYYTPGVFSLYIYVISDADTTLVINAPDGEWYGNDDYGSGRNPMVVFSDPSMWDGEDLLFDIWVGTYDEDLAEAKLYISEIDPEL